MAGMFEVLYDPHWQKMRVSFLAVNHQNGGFTTDEGTDDNLKRLNGYIFEAEMLPMNPAAEDPYQEQAARVWRGLNLLNATRMGFSGQGLKDTPRDNACKVYRDTLQGHHDSHTVQQICDRWNWDAVLQQLVPMYRDEPYWFKAIYDDLHRRRKVGFKKSGTLESRGELVKFLSLMEQVRGY